MPDEPQESKLSIVEHRQIEKKRAKIRKDLNSAIARALEENGLIWGRDGGRCYDTGTIGSVVEVIIKGHENAIKWAAIEEVDDKLKTIFELLEEHHAAATD